MDMPARRGDQNTYMVSGCPVPWIVSDIADSVSHSETKFHVEILVFAATAVVIDICPS